MMEPKRAALETPKRAKPKHPYAEVVTRGDPEQGAMGCQRVRREWGESNGGVAREVKPGSGEVVSAAQKTTGHRRVANTGSRDG